ncbi:AAA family ATPase [Fibrobacter intestinalis]|uniref:AAA family ATPase n=1 Tax=Fibrobacter sp. NR9 TaxID=1896200 RepID=UPI003514E9AF
MLEACVNSSKSEFAIIYGRRRIGKTFLVNQTFKERFDFCYVGDHHLDESEQLQKFAEALKKYGKSLFLPKLNDWFEAFNNLEQILEARKSPKKIIFMDEMPWIDTPNSKFVKALESFWNGWTALRDDIFLIANGSATSWMAENLFENQGGLYNRITAKIYLRPFNLHEVEEFCKKKRRKLGSIPNCGILHGFRRSPLLLQSYRLQKKPCPKYRYHVFY